MNASVKKDRFSFRTFTSFILAWAFLALIVSGVILYISPPGRIANWSMWRLGTLTKSQWQGVHILTAIVFLFGSLFHILKFNWNAFMNYITKRKGSGFRYAKELAVSILLFSAVLAGTIGEIRPFYLVTTAGESIKNSWSRPVNEPPVPHMEMLTVTQVADKLQMPESRALAILEKKGMTAGATKQTLAEVARQHKIAPREVYAALQPETAPTSAIQPESPRVHAGSGAGYGIKTVAEIASDLGMTVENALDRLKAHKITAKPEDSLRSVAQSAGVRPFELVDLLKQAAAKQP